MTSAWTGSASEITSSTKPYLFNGQQFVRLADTPALTPENSLTWDLEAFIDAQAADGSVLMGNRETPGHTTTFFKITPSKGVQLYKNGKELFRIPVTFPRGKWIKISVVKAGKDITVLCDGKELGTAVFRESAPSMPCYLGGDPEVTEYTRGRSLRPLFEGKNEGWRETLGVESQIGWMVTDSEGHKLIEYDYPYNGKTETQLLDLKADPYEMRHFPRNDANAKTWAKLEKTLDEWSPESHRRNQKWVMRKI